MASESKSAPAAESDTYKAVCVVVAGNASTDAEITRRVRDSVCAGLTSYSDIYHVVTRAQLEEYAALSGWKQGAATLVRALRAFLASDAADGSDPAATLEVLRARQAGDGGGGAAKKGPKGQLDAATISKLLGRDEKPKRNPEPRPPAAVSRIVLLHDFPESRAEAEAVLSGAAAPPAAQGSELAVGADQKYLHAVLDLRRTYDGAPVVRAAAQATGPTPEELGVPPSVSGPVERRASVPVNMIDFGKPPPPEPEPEPEPQVEAKGEEGDAGEGDGAGDGDGGDEDGDGGSKAGDGDAGDEAGAADAADDAGAGGEKEDDDLGDAEEDDDEDDSDAEPVAEKEPEEELPPEEEVVIETTKGGIDLWRDQANAKAGGDWDAVDFKDVTIDDFRGVPAADEVLVPQLHEVLVKIAKDRLRYEEWMAITTTEVPQGGKVCVCVCVCVFVAGWLRRAPCAHRPRISGGGHGRAGGLVLGGAAGCTRGGSRHAAHHICSARGRGSRRRRCTLGRASRRVVARLGGAAGYVRANRGGGRLVVGCVPCCSGGRQGSQGAAGGRGGCRCRGSGARVCGNARGVSCARSRSPGTLPRSSRSIGASRVWGC